MFSDFLTLRARGDMYIRINVVAYAPQTYIHPDIVIEMDQKGKTNGRDAPL